MTQRSRALIQCSPPFFSPEDRLLDLTECYLHLHVGAGVKEPLHCSNRSTVQAETWRCTRLHANRKVCRPVTSLLCMFVFFVCSSVSASKQILITYVGEITIFFFFFKFRILFPGSITACTHSWQWRCFQLKLSWKLFQLSYNFRAAVLAMGMTTLRDKVKARA